MFKTEDYVLHRRFRYAGTVTGYGQRLVDGNYMPTLKVRLSSSVMDSQGIIVEDLTSRWIRSNIEDDLKTLLSF
jgi:hypothetical protein